MIVVALWLGAGALFCENALRGNRRDLSAKWLDVVGGHAATDVEMTAADGAILRATYVRADRSRDCVLVLHGISDSRVGSLGFAPMFVDAGYSVLAPDSRAHGLSGGDLVTYGLLEVGDVLRWAEWLHKRGCQELYGLGESMGGSILIQAAAQQTVFGAIVAECPFSDLPSIAEYRVVQWMHGRMPARIVARSLVSSALVYARVRYGLSLRSASPVEGAARLRTPLLLIHGTEDANVPPAHSQAIAKADPKAEMWFVEGAGHTGAAARDPVQFRSRVLGWFQGHSVTRNRPRPRAVRWVRPCGSLLTAACGTPGAASRVAWWAPW